MSIYQHRKDLVLSSISNYEWHKVDLFFKSLEKTGFSGKAVIFIENVDDQTQIMITDLNLDIQLIPIQRQGPEKEMAINDYRFILYERFLRNDWDCYNNVLITDIRDVFFQADPFQLSWSPDSITVAKEVVIVGQEYWNTRWVMEKFGEQVFEEIKDRTVICSGTTFGPARFILQYLEVMVHYIFEIGYVRSTDQGVHNYIIHTGKLHPVAYADNVNGPILTLRMDTDIHVNGVGDTVLLKNGKLAPIVHQYDGYPHLVELFKYKAGDRSR